MSCFAIFFTFRFYFKWLMPLKKVQNNQLLDSSFHPQALLFNSGVVFSQQPIKPLTINRNKFRYTHYIYKNLKTIVHEHSYFIRK